MSLTQERTSEKVELKEWDTKANFKIAYRHASFAMMKREIDRGKISVRLDIDGKIKINTEEAKRAFGFVDSGLF